MSDDNQENYGNIRTLMIASFVLGTVGLWFLMPKFTREMDDFLARNGATVADCEAAGGELSAVSSGLYGVDTKAVCLTPDGRTFTVYPKPEPTQ